MRSVPVEQAWKRKYPEQVSWAVSVDSEGKAGIISLGWCMPTSFDPDSEKKRLYERPSVLKFTCEEKANSSSRTLDGELVEVPE